MFAILFHAWITTYYPCEYQIEHFKKDIKQIKKAPQLVIDFQAS